MLCPLLPTTRDVCLRFLILFYLCIMHLPHLLQPVWAGLLLRSQDWSQGQQCVSVYSIVSIVNTVYVYCMPRACCI